MKQYTLTKPFQLVPGIILSQKNTAKSFDATDGLLTNMKVRGCFLSHTTLFMHAKTQTHTHIFWYHILKCHQKFYLIVLFFCATTGLIGLGSLMSWQCSSIPVMFYLYSICKLHPSFITDQHGKIMQHHLNVVKRSAAALCRRSFMEPLDLSHESLFSPEWKHEFRLLAQGVWCPESDKIISMKF